MGGLPLDRLLLKFESENKADYDPKEVFYGLRVYTSKLRKQIIEFCGWSNFIPPFYATEKGKISIDDRLDQLTRSYQKLFERDGLILDQELKDKNEGANRENEDDSVSQLSLSNTKLRGSMSRAVVMACVHFDFSQACYYIDKYELTSNRKDYLFQESAINKRLLRNIAGNLRDVQKKSAEELLTAFREQIG